jgi:hypothetical protein
MVPVTVARTVVLAVVAVATVAGRGSEHTRRRAAERQARAQASSPPFDVFHVGAAFEGLSMNEAAREHVDADPEFPESARRDDVTYLYGESTRETGGGADGSCLPPLEVQSTPLCEKHVSLYRDPAVGAREYESKTIKGVPAASFDGGRMLEIYTADTTITLYGQRPELVLRAAQALRRAAPKNIPSGIRPLKALTPATESVPQTLAPPDPEALVREKPCQ